MISVLNITNLLYNSDDIDTTIIECINSKIDGNEYPLNESIELIPELLEYSILIESVDEVNIVKKEIKNIKNEKDPEKIANIFDRLIKAIKNAFNWWYKIDPNKKYKTLHTLLKLLVAVISIIFIFWGPGRGIIIKNIAARLPIGYEGSSTILKFFFSKTRIASIVVGTIYGQILKIIKNLDSKIEYAVNVKDIDKSIEEYDKTIDMINKMLEDVEDPKIKEQLEKTKKTIEDSLAELIKIKEKNSKKKDKKDDN